MIRLSIATGLVRVDFTRPDLPDPGRECQCEPVSWSADEPRTDVCGRYVETDDDVCVTCYHGARCHEREAAR